MNVLEYIPATRRILRHLSSEPEDFAAEQGVKLHELSQSVAQHSLEFMRTFSLETPAHWFGYLVVESESQQMVGTCSFKGPPVDFTLEIAVFAFPGYERRGIGTAMAKFLIERAAQLPKVRAVEARAATPAAAHIAEKIGMRQIGAEAEETIWRVEFDR